MNREERRQLAMRVRRGLATKEEIEAFKKRSAGRGVGYGRSRAESPYYVRGCILRRAERRLLVGIHAWRDGVRAPSICHR